MIHHLTDIISLIEINLKVRYRQTFIGFLWVIFNPVVLFCVQLSLFSLILNHSPESYPLYLLSGMIPWFYISQTAEMGCNYITNNAALIKNLKIHPFKLVLALSVENFVNMLCASIFILIILVYRGIFLDLTFAVNYLLGGLYLVALISLFTFISSLLNVLYKDVKYILHFLFMLLYFSTPTFFYTSSLSTEMHQLITYNPFYWVISVFRLYLNSNDYQTIFLVNLAIIVFLTLSSISLWKYLKNRIYLKL